MTDFATAYALWEQEQYKVYEQKSEGNYYDDEDEDYWNERFDLWRERQAENDFI